MIGYLRAASPWLRFVGIVGFIGAGFLVLMGLGFVTVLGSLGGLVSAAFDAGAGFGTLLGAGLGGAFGAVYIIIGVLYFFPAFFTFQFGSKIRAYLATSEDRFLEEAFRHNKSYWRFNGIMLIISLAAVPILTVIGVIAGIAAAL
jgi:hypothetical protein